MGTPASRTALRTPSTGPPGRTGSGWGAPGPAPRVLSCDPAQHPRPRRIPVVHQDVSGPLGVGLGTVQRQPGQVARPVPVRHVGCRVVEGEVADEGAGQRHLLRDPQVNREVPEGAQLRPQHEDPVDDQHHRAGTRDAVPEGDQTLPGQPVQVGAVPVVALGRQLAAPVALFRRTGEVVDRGAVHLTGEGGGEGAGQRGLAGGVGAVDPDEDPLVDPAQVGDRGRQPPDQVLSQLVGTSASSTPPSTPLT